MQLRLGVCVLSADIRKRERKLLEKAGFVQSGNSALAPIASTIAIVSTFTCHILLRRKLTAPVVRTAPPPSPALALTTQWRGARLTATLRVHGGARGTVNVATQPDTWKHTLRPHKPLPVASYSGPTISEPPPSASRGNLYVPHTYVPFPLVSATAPLAVAPRCGGAGFSP